jgi:hypothetical protein
MKLAHWTAIARPIDPHYATNRVIALLALGVALAGSALQFSREESWRGSLSWGLSAGLSVFLAWALARELDPDRDLAAFVAAGLALAGLLVWGLPELLPLFWLLMLLRVVNRCPGLRARWLDSLALLGLGSWLAWQNGWTYALLTGLGFLLDALLPQPHRRHLVFGTFAVLFAAALAIQGEGRAHDSALHWVPIAGIVLSAALFLLVMARSRRVSAVGDATGEPLIARRVQAGQALGLLAAITITAGTGLPGFVAVGPLWAAILGTGLWQAGILIGRGVTCGT